MLSGEDEADNQYWISVTMRLSTFTASDDSLKSPPAPFGIPTLVHFRPRSAEPAGNYHRISSLSRFSPASRPSNGRRKGRGQASKGPKT